MREQLIRISGLTKVYGSGETAVHALDGIELTVEEGEFLAIMGPSGCGKSTLLNMIGALDQPTEGEVWVAGETWRAQERGRVPCADGRLRFSTAQLAADPDRART